MIEYNLLYHYMMMKYANILSYLNVSIRNAIYDCIFWVALVMTNNIISINQAPKSVSQRDALPRTFPQRIIRAMNCYAKCNDIYRTSTHILEEDYRGH